MADRFLKTALRIAEKAGAFLLKHHRRPKQVSHKDERVNLVTNIDRESEAMVVKALRKAFPDHDIVAEEDTRSLTGSPFRWYIDPLDGTVNYVHAFPPFSISIGLVRNGKAACGVVFAPAMKELFTAEYGKGAYRNGKKIRVSVQSELQDAFLTTGFPYTEEGRRLQNALFAEFILKTQAIRRMGCASMDMCYTACGIFDGFWEHGLKPWDLAAGTLMIEEAGGAVTDYAGRGCNIENGIVLATNGRIHEAMLNVISKVRQ
jgi:myo-inositol-1(or 4)-monophosphatase